MMPIGFMKWYEKIQIRQDKLTDLQITKTEKEIAVLNKQLEKAE
jgi:hypothetical protein